MLRQRVHGLAIPQVVFHTWRRRYYEEEMEGFSVHLARRMFFGHARGG